MKDCFLDGLRYNYILDCIFVWHEKYIASHQLDYYSLVARCLLYVCFVEWLETFTAYACPPPYRRYAHL